MGLGPVADVVGVLAIINPYDDGVAALWDRLIEHLSDDDLRALPQALEAAVPLVAREPAILALVGELAVMADLSDLAAPFLEVATARQDLAALLAAASLIGNPAVDPALHERLRATLEGWPLGGEIERLVQLRADPRIPPETATERALLLQRWPGAKLPVEASLPGTPTVVIDDDLPARLVAQLTAGLLHRRIPMRRFRSTVRPTATWFASQGVLAVVTGPGRMAILNEVPSFPGGSRHLGYRARRWRSEPARCPPQHRPRASVDPATRTPEPQVTNAVRPRRLPSRCLRRS